MIRIYSNTGLRNCSNCRILTRRLQNIYSVESKSATYKFVDSHRLLDQCHVQCPISRQFAMSASYLSATHELHEPRTSTIDEHKLPNKLKHIRSRLIELHRLTRVKTPSDDLRTELVGTEKANRIDLHDDLTENIIEDGNEISENGADADFIRNISKPDIRRSEAYVAMPFGLARFDSMNKPGNQKTRYNTNKILARHMDIFHSDMKKQSTVGEHKPEKNRHLIQHGIINEKKNDCQASTVEPSTMEGQENLFDKQYFDVLLTKSTNNEVDQSFITNSNIVSNVSSTAEIGARANFFDEQYFGESLHDKSVPCVEQEYARSEDMYHKRISQMTSTSNQQVTLKDIAETHCLQITDAQINEFQSAKLPVSEKTVQVKKNDHQLPIVISGIDVQENLFDEQYFGALSANMAKDKLQLTRDHVTSATLNSGGDSALNFLEEQYFGAQNQDNSAIAKTQSKPPDDLKYNEFQTAEYSTRYHPFPSSASYAGNQHSTSTANFKVSNKSFSELSFKEDVEDTTVVESVTRRDLKTWTKPVANIENPQTAYDYAMKLRLDKRQKHEVKSDKVKEESVLPRESKWTGSVDSKGFRILKDQVCDLQQLTQDQVVSILKDSIIYEDDKLLAIDKPYGLASHGGPGIHHSIGKLLEPLAHRVDKSGKINTLHLVHRLDKETTGVMVLAKTLQVSEFLLAMFKKRQVIKHYWVITKGIPSPSEGIVDIPLMEGTVGNKYRMQLQPVKVGVDQGLHRVSTSSTYEAVTNYRVLSSYGSAALVECTPESGVKHQIRCHLAFGLNTPILGDHKYSHFSKIAPQRLHPEILNLMGVRQAKVRHIPMHLHAKALVLPEWLNGRNLFISARLPKHFVQNMKWLKLKPPS